MKNLSILVFVLFGLCTSSRSFAAGWKLEVGASVSNLVQRFSAPKGFESKVSAGQGLLGVSKTFKLFNRVNLRPEVFALLPWRKGADGTTLTFTTHFGLHLNFQISKPFSLNMGHGLLWETYCSKGEAITLGNGMGTSTFYTPSRWTQIVLPTALIGIEWKFSKKVGLQIGAVVSEYLETDKRRIRGLGKLVIDL